MNQTNGDSIENEVNCISLHKENEKGFKEEGFGEKDSFILEGGEFKVYNSELLEDGSLKKQNGTVIPNFADYKKVKENNKNRVTEFAIKNRRRQNSSER